MDLTYDSETNSLRLTPTQAGGSAQPSRAESLDAILDIGEGGRLIGVEFPSQAADLTHWRDDPATRSFVSLDSDGRVYIQIMPGDSSTARSTPIRLIAEYGHANDMTALVIPRRGDGYEITYPSGNQ